MNTPKAIESRPAPISIHSPSMTLRYSIATMISKMPRTTAHAAIKNSKTIAVRPGYTKVAIPAKMLTTPRMSACQNPPPKPPVSSMMPSTRQYAPYSRTSEARVRPGHTNASTPKSMAARPRTSRIHQCPATMCRRLPPIDCVVATGASSRVSVMVLRLRLLHFHRSPKMHTLPPAERVRLNRGRFVATGAFGYATLRAGADWNVLSGVDHRLYRHRRGTGRHPTARDRGHPDGHGQRRRPHLRRSLQPRRDAWCLHPRQVPSRRCGPLHGRSGVRSRCRRLAGDVLQDRPGTLAVRRPVDGGSSCGGVLLHFCAGLRCPQHSHREGDARQLVLRPRDWIYGHGRRVCGRRRLRWRVQSSRRGRRHSHGPRVADHAVDLFDGRLSGRYGRCPRVQELESRRFVARGWLC